MLNDYILFGENEDEDKILDYEKCIGWEDKMTLLSSVLVHLSKLNYDAEKDYIID